MATPVLIVEDRAPMRNIIRTLLHAMGVRSIYEADNGIEALRILNQQNKRSAKNFSSYNEAESIKLVICDWNMPQMSGIELLQEVRRDEDFVDLPFLMLTSENDEAHITTAISNGVTDYLVKPFQAKILEAKVRKILAIPATTA